LEPLVQAADVLCGVSTAFLAQLARFPRQLPTDAKQLVLLLLGAFFEPDLRKYFMFIGLDASGMRFGQTLIDIQNTMRPEDWG
jgi:hypothetical protein